MNDMDLTLAIMFLGGFLVGFGIAGLLYRS